MLERLRRARAAGMECDRSGGELPLIKTGVTLRDFFEMTRERTRNGTILPDWRVSSLLIENGQADESRNGELYLEKHRAVGGDDDPLADDDRLPLHKPGQSGTSDTAKPYSAKSSSSQPSLHFTATTLTQKRYASENIPTGSLLSRS